MLGLGGGGLTGSSTKETHRGASAAVAASLSLSLSRSSLQLDLVLWRAIADNRRSLANDNITLEDIYINCHFRQTFVTTMSMN